MHPWGRVGRCRVMLHVPSGLVRVCLHSVLLRVRACAVSTLSVPPSLRACALSPTHCSHMLLSVLDFGPSCGAAWCPYVLTLCLDVLRAPSVLPCACAQASCLSGWGVTDGGWRVADGGWGVTDSGRGVTDGSWRVTDGGCRVTDGGWRGTDGSWTVNDGGWGVTDGGWRVTDGGWTVNDGGRGGKQGHRRHFPSAEGGP